MRAFGPTQMIFGFNTDIKHGDTVYHVQSEARQAEKLLQTQVFVRGRCIGKRATSYAELVGQPGFSDDQMHEMLKAQHRATIDGIRDGKLEQLLGDGSQTMRIPAMAVPETPPGLSIKWLNARAAESAVVLKFQVTEAGAGVAGAQLTSKLDRDNGQPVYVQAVTDAGGVAEMSIAMENGALSHAAVVVQVKAGEKSVTRKFVLRKNA